LDQKDIKHLKLMKKCHTPDKKLIFLPPGSFYFFLLLAIAHSLKQMEEIFGIRML